MSAASQKRARFIHKALGRPGGWTQRLCYSNTCLNPSLLQPPLRLVSRSCLILPAHSGNLSRICFCFSFLFLEDLSQLFIHLSICSSIHSLNKHLLCLLFFVFVCFGFFGQAQLLGTGNTWVNNTETVVMSFTAREGQWKKSGSRKFPYYMIPLHALSRIVSLWDKIQVEPYPRFVGRPNGAQLPSG